MSSDIPYDALIFDLDGVVTDTRGLHFDAWRETLGSYGFSEEDYAEYVDGKPRKEGILSFLGAKEIILSNDEVDALAETKDNLYLQKLRTVGPKVFADSVRAINQWKDEGIPVAVVSSSRNCSEVLERAGLLDLFDAQVDSVIAEKLHLRGKPEADYFVEAAHLLGKAPNECAIVEDSISGIKAGVTGHFKGVIGVSREGQTPPQDLYNEGADVVVDSLEKIGHRKNAIKAWEEIKERVGEREIVLFLDFDGTLADIVSHPDIVKVRPSVLEILDKCSRSIKSAIISGRDRQDVKHRVNLENFFYAGCHGFDISGPGGFHFNIEEAYETLPFIKEARKRIVEIIKKYDGALIEDKKYFVAVHYRNVDSPLQLKIRQEVIGIIQGYPELAVREGKKVVEMAPNVNWGKGDAIRKLNDVLCPTGTCSIPVYLGDDLTDEDAFKEISGIGISIKVGHDENTLTAADFELKDPREVETFLGLLCDHFSGREKKWRPGA